MKNETFSNFPIYYNGYVGNGEYLTKLAEMLRKDNENDEAFDFDKHGYLLNGNPFGC